MEIVNWLDRDDVEKILFAHDNDGYLRNTDFSVMAVVDMLLDNGIKFYRSLEPTESKGD